MLASLDSNLEKSAKCFVFSSSCDMPEIRKRLELLELRKLSMIFIEFPENFLEQFEVMEGILHFSNAAIFRLFSSSVLQKDIDSIIYLDGDLLVRKPINEGTFPNHVFSALIEKKPSKEASLATNYFNSGVFSTKLSYWRENNVEELLRNFLKDNLNSIYKDQDALNSVFATRNFPPLSDNLNFIIQNYNRKEIEQRDPMIVHFAGPLKPWKLSTPNSFYVHEWRTFAKSVGIDLYNSRNILLYLKRFAILLGIHLIVRKLRGLLSDFFNKAK